MREEILVVEDERIIALDLADTLTELGYAVVGSVATGEDALVQARALRPSVVLMDIRLAGALDGIETAARIRQERDVPVIFLTSHADQPTLDRAKASEPLAYLVKPFRGPELRCAIEIASHKHQSDQRLREREKWLETTLRSIGDGVVASDEDNRVMLMNPVAEALTGFRPDEAIGHVLGEIVKLVDDDGEKVLVDRAGGTHPVDQRVAPIIADDGRKLGSVVVLRDVAQQRAARLEIRKLNEDLEQRVQARTAELELAYRELESFSHSVAHDLRAPLRAIRWFSEALAEENLGEQSREYVVRLRRTAEKVMDLVDDLLRLARTAETALVRRTVDVSALAFTIVEEIRLSQPDRDVVVEIQPGISVDGDYALVRVALANLLSNAWKFTASCPRAVIEIGRDGDSIFVRDNGVGFVCDDTRLFGAFQRFHGSEIPGNGVGLAIVRRIVHRHGGHVRASSQPGGPTTFWFSLDSGESAS